MRLGLNHIATFRQSNLWNNVDVEEKFHVILANPPLIPAHPESLLEAALADSPTMEITKSFILGCGAHLYPTGRVYMVLSDACKVSVGDPLQFALTVAQQVALTASVKATLDVGHEMYYLIQLQHSLTGSGNSRYDLHTAGVFA
jgi:methylase of polypeptide subunit release factors